MSLAGQQLGRYRLQQVLGVGGMGEVYLAIDPVIQRQVAIKVIREEGSAYPNPTLTQESARLFQREMKAIATLDHPHILPLFDYGEETINGAKLSYLVMPYRQEGTLATWLQQHQNGGLLSLADVAAIVGQAADALQHAHDHQIIHQDVKPSNFLLRFKKDDPAHPDLLLADFGVSKFSSATANVSQSIRGTPASMAPEQWEGQPVPATDQYALAVMAYELLTGRPPFQGGLSQLMYQHFHVAPPRPGSINPRLPSSIDDVLLQALAKKPEQRFATISAFGRAFQQAAFSSAPTSADNFRLGNPPTPLPPLPRPVPTPTPKLPADIFAVLAISPAEAQSGGSRIVMLPGGRQITVPLPTGAFDGQVISVQDHGAPGGTATTLNLKLSIQQPGNPALASASDRAEQTMRGSSSDLPVAHIQPVRQQPGRQSPIVPSAPLTPPPPPPPGFAAVPPTPLPSSNPNFQYSGPIPQQGAGTGVSTPSGRRSTMSKGRAAILAAVALLVVLGSIGIFAAVRNGQAASASANATATANATAFANNATSTANANVQNTQVAQYYGMLTATATAFQSLYSASTSEPPALNDPLGANILGYGWGDFTNSIGGCQFSGGAYHASILNVQNFETCFATRTNFANIAFQVQMKIVKGDCGGLLFRADPTGDMFYYLEVCQDGAFSLLDYTDSSKGVHTQLSNGNSSAVVTGLNQLNVITVVAKGSSLTFYVNQQGVDSVSSTTFGHGEIGVAAFPINGPTEVVYSYAKVWTL